MNKLIQYGVRKVIINGDDMLPTTMIIGSVVEYGDERLVMDSGSRIIGHLSDPVERINVPYSREYRVSVSDQMVIDKLK